MKDQSSRAKAATEPLKALDATNADRQLMIARYSPCGKILAAGACENTVRRFDAGDDKLVEVAAIEGHQGWVPSLAFHPSRELLFSADTWGQLRASEYQGKSPRTLWSAADAHDGWIRQVAVSSDGRWLASCGADGRVCVWSTAEGKRIREFHHDGQEVFSVAFHPDGKSLVSADIQAVVKQWDVEAGSFVREIDAKLFYYQDNLQEVAGLRLMIFVDGGKTLACAGGVPTNAGSVRAKPTIALVDWGDGKVRKTIALGDDKQGFVTDLAPWSTDGVIAVTSGTPGQGMVLLQRTTAAKPTYSNTKLANCQSLAMHPDGRQVVVVSTNARSNGNGRKLGEAYVGNHSPLNRFELANVL